MNDQILKELIHEALLHCTTLYAFSVESEAEKNRLLSIFSLPKNVQIKPRKKNAKRTPHRKGMQRVLVVDPQVLRHCSEVSHTRTVELLRVLSLRSGRIHRQTQTKKTPSVRGEGNLWSHSS